MKGECEIRWCKSGDENVVYATENIGDGAYRVTICKTCQKMFGNELPEPTEVEKKCRKAYKKA